MERQKRQRNRTSKHKIRHKIENKKDTATMDKQTQTPKKMMQINKYTKKMNIQKKEKKQNGHTEQSNSTTCYLSQDENNTNNISQTNTSPQNKTKPCPVEHTSPSPTQAIKKNQTPINEIDIILPSDTDYE